MTASELTRYFFHIREGGLIEDPDGSLLPDLEAACAFARLAARDLWAGAMRDGTDLSDVVIEIADSAGERLAFMPLTDALPDGLRKRLANR